MRNAVPVDLFSLKGKTALITGSSAGIGRAIALGFAEAGADVMLHGWHDAQGLSEVSQAISALGRRVSTAESDLTIPGSMATLYQACTGHLGAPDIVVHNAALQLRTHWRDIDYDAFRRQIDMNLFGGLQLFQSAVPAMAARGWGRLIAIGSVQEQLPNPDLAVYAASKSGMNNLVRNIARDLGGTGITVNAVAPGVVVTERNFNALKDPQFAARIKASIPLGSFAEAADMVGAALLLASEAGRYITGQTIRVDGMMGG
jgi:glucose 1-dehydrogenase